MQGRIALVGGVVAALASVCFLRFARRLDAGARGAASPLEKPPKA